MGSASASLEFASAEREHEHHGPSGSTAFPVTIWDSFATHVTSGELLGAAVVTIALAFGAQAIGILVGALLAACRLSGFALLRLVAGLYIWVFRGTAELLQLLAWYAILPLVGVRLGLVEVALVGLGLNEAARMSEIIRAGVISVRQGQTDAARALGMSRRVRLQHVIMPQAARVILPPTGSELNAMFKTTSLVAVIGLTELLRQGQLIATTESQPLAIFVAVALYYLAITTIWDIFQRRLERHFEYGDHEGLSTPRFTLRSGRSLASSAQEQP